MKSHNEYVIEYLRKKETEIEKKEKEKELVLQQKEKEILEMKNRILELEHKIDFAYEAFSPISVQQQVVKKETDRLKERLEEKSEEKKALEQESLELNEEMKTLQTLLEESEEKKTAKPEDSSDFKTVKMAGRLWIEQQDLERQRIARELHDTTVQNLTALLHKIDFCTQLLNVDPIRVRLELEIMSQVIKESVNGMREIIYDLRPMVFDDIGFESTLLQAIQRLQKGFDTKIVFETEGESYSLNQTIQLTILRVIQEAINNCKKHANAEKIEIHLIYQTEGIVLNIIDDGIGFDPKQKIDVCMCGHTGFGLSMMKERVYLLEGEFEVKSKEGDGTEIQVKIPVEKNENF